MSPKTHDLFREGEWLGWGGTDQHEEEDEGQDIRHVRHRLQDDTNDPGQGLHSHAHMHETKDPVAEPLRDAPQPFPDPSSSLPPYLPRQAELSPAGKAPHHFPSVQAGPPLFSRVPNSPEGVGNRDDIEFTNEEPQDQDKDDKEVEDVPAVLGGGVGQPQRGLSGPAHGDILGLPSPPPKDEGISVLLTAGPVICHSLLLLILLPTKHATQ